MGPDSSRAATPAVTDNVQRQRYEVTVDGHTAFLVYSRRPGPRVLVHTEVPEELRWRRRAPTGCGSSPSARSSRPFFASTPSTPTWSPSAAGRVAHGTRQTGPASAAGAAAQPGNFIRCSSAS
jgi:hypothetical protein